VSFQELLSIEERWFIQSHTPLLGHSHFQWLTYWGIGQPPLPQGRTPLRDHPSFRAPMGIFYSSGWVHCYRDCITVYFLLCPTCHQERSSEPPIRHHSSISSRKPTSTFLILERVVIHFDWNKYIFWVWVCLSCPESTSPVHTTSGHI
jgi:hypothetical protein